MRRSSSRDPLGIDGYRDAVLIGRGGYGSVYRATQRAFGRDVAVKVLDAGVDGNLQSFDAERLAIGLVSGHPQIVTVLDSGIDPRGRPYIVMDYMSGGSLALRLDEDGPIPWAEAVAIAVKLSGAVESAHRSGVLHRDIKPENVLVSGYGEPKLADFGVAQLTSGTRTHSGSVTGTLSYLAPEVLDGARITEASDVYSLGATLYTLIAGRPPFSRSEGEPLAVLVARIVADEPPHLEGSIAPEEIDAVIARSLDKDPAARPGSAEAFGRALIEAQLELGLEPTEMFFAPTESMPQIQVAQRSGDDSVTIAKDRSIPIPTRRRHGRASLLPSLGILLASSAVVVAIASGAFDAPPSHQVPRQRPVALEALDPVAPTPAPTADSPRSEGTAARRAGHKQRHSHHRSRPRAQAAIVAAAPVSGYVGSDDETSDNPPSATEPDAASEKDRTAAASEPEPPPPPNYPLYHLYNPDTDDHYYTRDSGDRTYKMAVGYRPVRMEGDMYKRRYPDTLPLITNDGIVGYIFKYEAKNTIPLYYLKKDDGTDLFTSDPAARDEAVDDGWRLVGIYGYIGRP